MQALTARVVGRQLGGAMLLDDAYLGGERNGGKGVRSVSDCRSHLARRARWCDGYAIGCQECGNSSWMQEFGWVGSRVSTSLSQA